MTGTIVVRLHRWIATAGARALGTRWLVRAPILLYRNGFGGLLGSRFLMLEHTGRISGATRHVILEVFNHPAPDIYVVAAGHGQRAQWLRNIKINPKVRLYVGGSSPVAATAHPLTQPEADRELASYRARHARLWAAFQPILEATLGSPITNTDTPLPMVEMRVEIPAPSARTW
jgi:deazaflavin-dependent oxidoreductase (nitroreductase family)